ncbi:immunoglobulin-like domain-containing protein [Erysipelothrix aquatica]|uniref:immunoglobulin-like domain-containing protein n=1 Tax=Erysipelothrix aquatica TaxID=2683714 RepID=UPI0013592228|nr:hypothetical protein [Erysipelothrix aquatica]
MKHAGRLFAVLSILVFLTACQSEQLDIQLKKDRYEVGELSTACDAVATVNNVAVSEIDTNNKTLITGGKKISCSGSELNSLGDKILIFTGEKASKEFVITLEDTTPPVIHFDGKEIAVEVNNEFFNIHDLIKVTDNFDKNVKLSVDGAVDINSPGDYALSLIASDASGNQTKKDVVVHVTEREKEIITVIEERPIYVDGSSSGSSSSNNGSSNQQNGETPSINKGNKPAGREFLFSDGYNMQTAPSACESSLTDAHRQGWGGRCERIGEGANIKGSRLVIFD